METFIDKNTGRVKAVFGKYLLETYDEDSLWLENEAGEGMQVWNNDFAELLDEYFIKKF